ncbi:Alpha/Beta hydrolase protein [Phycomyces nitens]|nr:Alpha/Beta hydrolase protein [Phycomyces nitens]
MMVAFQNKLIYMGYIPYGSRHQPYVPQSQSLQVREQTVVTPDNKKLRGFIVQRTPHPKGPVLVYFQGNAGNMLDRFGLFKVVLDAVPDLTIVGISYRGFGSSNGTATERGLMIDSKAILDHTLSLYPNRPIYLYGHSLGGSVAIGLAAQIEAATQPSSYSHVVGLILENTYTSIEDMVQALYPRYSPYPHLARLFLWNHWPSKDTIKNIKIPILFLSSDNDEIVPVEHMRALAKQATAPSTFIRFKRALHMDIYSTEPGAYKAALREFIGPNDSRDGEWEQKVFDAKDSQ